MAKFGEGDARWIVEDRADGANVHNWHWSEKDALPWVKSRLAELLENNVVLDGQGGCHIKIAKVEKVDGEAYVNIRKGKIIPGYEFSLKLAWQGEVKDLQGGVVAAAGGAVDIPYVADENHDEDPDVRVTVAGDVTPPVQRLLDAMVAQGRPLIRQQIAVLVKELQAGGPAREELEKKKKDAAGGGGKGSGGSTQANAAAIAAAAKEKAEAAAQKEKAAKELKKKKEEEEKKGGKTISMTQRFHCRPSDLYDVLMDERRWMAFTHSKAQVSREVGGSFSLFDGAVSGSNVKLETNSMIVQKWRFNTWPDGVYSMVCMTIEEPNTGNTILKLTQTGVPDEDRFGNATVYDTTERGWRDLIFNRIRAVFGYGV